MLDNLGTRLTIALNPLSYNIKSLEWDAAFRPKQTNAIRLLDVWKMTKYYFLRDSYFIFDANALLRISFERETRPPAGLLLFVRLQWTLGNCNIEDTSTACYTSDYDRNSIAFHVILIRKEWTLRWKFHSSRVKNKEVYFSSSRQRFSVFLFPPIAATFFYVNHTSFMRWIQFYVFVIATFRSRLVLQLSNVHRNHSNPGFYYNRFEIKSAVNFL